jgi:hypothetical protein
MTKADKCRNTLQNEEMSNEVLLAHARNASGQDPEVYRSIRTEGAGEWYFRFDDGSVLAVDIVEPNVPGLRSLSVQIPV